MELITIISLISFSIFCFTFGMFVGTKRTFNLFKRMKFKIEPDNIQPNIYKLIPDDQKRGKVEFLPDATSDELDDMQKEPKWRKFLNSFKKV